MNDSLLGVGGGQWAVGSEQWAVGGGQWAVKRSQILSTSKPHHSKELKDLQDDGVTSSRTAAQIHTTHGR
ncbi:MAG: hypothetical protein WBN92_19300 [Terriglobia bacterium]